MSSSPHGTGVAGNVVGAGKNDDDLGMKIDHILAKANQHLRRGLPANAAIDVRLAGKIFVEMPDVGDRVAEKDDAILSGRGRLECGIGLAVAGQLAEVIGEDGDARSAVLIETSKTSGRESKAIGRPAAREGGSQKCANNERKDRRVASAPQDAFISSSSLAAGQGHGQLPRPRRSHNLVPISIGMQPVVRQIAP